MMSSMKPAPLQFVKLQTSSDRYRSAQEQQLNKVAIAKPKNKEFDADWQSDLDNWKSNRRKQQEHIIERLVEVKKFETDRLDDGFRKRSKTFNEMIQERGKSGRLRSLPALYQDDDDGNDLSDLGLSTSCGKKSDESLKECAQIEQENVFCETEKDEKKTTETVVVTEQTQQTENGFDRAIKDYVDFAESKKTTSKVEDDYSDSKLQPMAVPSYRKPVTLPIAETKRRLSAPKIEEKVMLLKNRSQSTKDLHSASINELPKVDISKRREMFEKAVTEVQSMPATFKPSLKKKLSEPVEVARLAPVNHQQPSQISITKPTIESKTESTMFYEEEKDEEKNLTQSQQQDSIEEEEKPIVAMEKERLCLAPTTTSDDNEYHQLGHHHELTLSDLVNRHSIDSLDQVCGQQTVEDPDDGNYPGSCLSAEDSGIHTEDMSSCVSQADDEEQRMNLQPSPVQQHQPSIVDHVDSSYNMVLELTPINALEPPKEKPPPPPIDDGDNYTEEVTLSEDSHSVAHAVDSAKRIKKELWMKRSSFLGLEDTNGNMMSYENDLENLKSRPPDLTLFLEEERRLEKQLYKQNKPERLQNVRIYENVNLPPKNVYVVDDGEDSESNQYMKDILQVEEQSRNNQMKNKAVQNNIGEKLVKKLKELEEDLNNQESMRVGSAHWLPPTRHSLQDISSVTNSRPPLDHTQSMPNLEQQQPTYNQHHQPEDYTWSQNSFARPVQQNNGYAKRKPSISQPEKYNYQHWLIQEAEHRRLVDRCNRQIPPLSADMPRSRTRPALPPPPPPMQSKKPLPDSVINTITQRVQDRLSFNDFHRHEHNAPQESMLSVSGKKKCSHCTIELGRGAAMIIESLQLFYHIECFKCCVCCVQLGDGLMGTDVRVRNKKLHCHNCFSSDDGVKFSCV
ncbi:LIM and calponin homology domains-containing protein 1-like isoform X7 [Daktulosphaira vitifoliae]|uniref:LIM and calponin homology domains-containing protein 1-like isoform X1 n=2 Tax=Daktulosphaira vitifoliae TaxID=58002 RepID=UPI0021A98D84|nr:LIM and calponin homology domains-containing protein 1-like isoform X1 [Daktulosphaira vitifoliae]XP_050537476.1 LIM and calponin homology domains-containing protein 1-like isoform X2 [Daktulosphaira vitifoliae]XP_050537477.1 LIM and calponin homology domains-containing protein 1-like isoform X3 [Daktulosphaira vitifoliae]XP_050537478.1 LIM and calponin homology domains-containing protein 1-like isoform X4 [Daktulosphaira vitifoliae]XP_050537479.1 LIM and calponin homology domains-containing